MACLSAASTGGRAHAFGCWCDCGSALYDESLMNPEVPDLVRRFPNLVAFTDRIRSTYFSHELAWEETMP